MKIKICLFFAALLTISEANATTININNGGSANVSDATTGDIINFSGTTGTLVVDATETLDSITASNNQSGTVSVSSANTLTISNDIGTSTNSIRNIAFSAAGTLVVDGDIYTSSSGITTTVDKQGNLTLSGTANQTISAAIGSSTLRLDTVSITQGAGTITFSGNVFADNLSTSSSGAAVTIDGTHNLDFNNSTFTQNTTIDNTGTNSFGATTISDSKTLTLNSDSSLSTLTFGSSGNLVIASGKTTTITGNVSGTGLIKGSVDGAGGVLFSGSAAQAIASTVQLGDVSDRLNKVSISNTHASGVTFNNDVFSTTLDFANGSGTTSIATIASGKTFNISGNITQSGAGSSVINGAGSVLLSGSSAQTVSSKFGSGTSDRLGELEIDNTGGVTLNKDSYINVLTSTGTTTITNNAALDVNTFNVDESATIAGSGTNSLGATTIASSKTLTLNSDASLSSLALGSSGTTVIASGKTATITGDVSGTGLIKGSSSGLGSVLFSGASAQTVASTVELGDVSDILNQISISNTHASGVTFNNDVFTTTFDFANNSGTSTATIASGKTINIDGDITQSGAGSSVINGDGKVSLSGSSAQTVNSLLGSSTSDRLGELEINNSSGVTFNQNAFLTTLTQTSGAITIAHSKTIDVANAVDLSAKTLNIGVGTADTSFGKIVSGAGITVDGSTAINFDYSNNSLFVTHDGVTQFNIAESTSGISGTISSVSVTDNSFLFNNTLAVSGNNIVTTISADTTNFNINTLGESNFTLLNNALLYTNLTAGIIGITSQQQLEDNLRTLRPSNNGAVMNTSIAINDATTNIAKLHMQQINSDVNGFFVDNKYESDNKLWGQIYGSKAKQSQIGGNDGYTANMGGIIFGSDHIFKGQTNSILGGALAYSAANISSDVRADSIGGTGGDNDKYNIDSYQLILYNNNSAKNGLGFYNNNIVNFAYNKYSSKRNIIVGATSEIASADFNGYSYGARSDVGYHFKLSDDWLFSPNVGVKYFSLNQDNYRETGAGNDGLVVKNKAFNDVASDIGFALASKFKDDDITYFPKISTSWEHSLTNNDQESTIAFIGGGTEMQNNSKYNQQNKFNFGAALNIVSDIGPSSLQIEYNLQLSKKFISNGGSLQYKYAF